MSTTKNMLNTSIVRTVTFASVATWAMAGCGSSFQGGGTPTPQAALSTPGSTNTSTSTGSGTTTTGNSTSGSSSSTPTTGSTATSTPSAAQNLQSLGVIGLINGSLLGLGQMQVLSLNTTNMTLELSVPIPTSAALTGLGVMVPLTRPPGATFGFEPLASGGSGIVLTIPLATLVKGVALPSQTSTLPNGLPLPGVAAGALPAYALTLPSSMNINGTVYFDANIIGVFVAANYTLPAEITIPITSPDGHQTWGYLTSVPAFGTAKGGYFLSVQIPPSIAQMIQSNL